LGDETVQICETRGGNVELLSADIVNGLVIHHEGAVRVFQGSVGREDGVVWLDDGAAHLRRRIYAKFELRFLAIIGGEALHQKSTKAGTSSATERVEDLLVDQICSLLLLGYLRRSLGDQSSCLPIA
jgi:hypothetical protein